MEGASDGYCFRAKHSINRTVEFISGPYCLFSTIFFTHLHARLRYLFHEDDPTEEQSLLTRLICICTLSESAKSYWFTEVGLFLIFCSAVGPILMTESEQQTVNLVRPTVQVLESFSKYCYQWLHICKWQFE